MEAKDLKSMDAEELWKLHEELTAQLSTRLVAEKNKLEERLRALQSQRHRMRRPYPKVLPKFRIQRISPRHGPGVGCDRGGYPRRLKRTRS